VARPDLTKANQQWAMDFMADTLADGRLLRVLTLIDVFSRECIMTCPPILAV
jgi:putative transposase